MSYCDVPAFYSVKNRKACKQHKCCECGAEIKKGEVYVSCCGCWDGKVSTFRQHQHCAEACRYIRDHLNRADDWEDGCIGFGELLSYYSDIGYPRELPKEFRSLIAKVKNGRRKAKASAKETA